MKKNSVNRTWLLLTTLAGFAALLSGITLSSKHHYLLAGLLCLSAVVVYFLQVFFVCEWNWLDFRAVFSGVWLGTIGLAALRLAEYQKVWENKTWLLLAVSYLMLQIGVTVGLNLAPKFYDKLESLTRKFKLGKLTWRMNPNRLFWICLVTTLIGLTCFLINVAIKGFIPAFSDIYNAYTVFYTKFHVFAVAAVAVAPLCYYCIVTQPISVFKKIILALCIIYLVFAFPILVVSRGVFVVAALGLTVCVYYLHGKRLIVFILCVAMIGAGYMLGSELRNYTDEQMSFYFQPAKIEIPVETVPKEPTYPQENPSETSEDVTGAASDATDETVEDIVLSTEEFIHEETDPAVKEFSLSPKMAFVYSYVTVSHDNFNEAVVNVKNYTLGGKQLAPFNVILRSERIRELSARSEFYQVNPFLNTINVVGEFYYDFGSIGVAVLMLMWAVIFGIIQGIYDRSNNIFWLMVLGNTMVPVALSFFSAWLGVFSHWMMWGVALLAAIAAYLTFAEKSTK